MVVKVGGGVCLLSVGSTRFTVERVVTILSIGTTTDPV